MADVATKDPAAQRKVRQKGRWLPMVVGTVAAGLLAAVAWFGLHFFRDSAYEDERAFRILGHIVGQFGNFQGAVAGALQLVPTGTYLPEQDEKIDKKIKDYQRSLALREVTLAVARTCSPSGADPRPEFRISLERDFSMCRIACPDATNGESCGPDPIALTLSGPLAEQLPAFIFQDFFDSVVIAADTGVALASVPRGQDRGYQVQLHEVAAVDPLGGNAAELLSRAAHHIIASGAGAKKSGNDADKNAANDADKSAGEDTPAGPVPGYATVFNDKIAGQSVRVFVLPFVPAHPTQVGQDREPAQQLYLIALKQQRILGALNEALGSGGALAVTLSVLFGILAWPLLSLRFESRQEGIAPILVLAILISLLLMPAVISTAGFSLWSRYRLTLWADAHAELYARRVEQVLIQELDAGVHVLEQLEQQYQHFASSSFTKEAGTEGNVVCIGTRSKCRHPLEWHPSRFALPDWSPIRSAAPLNVEGKSSGFTLSYFAPASISNLDLHDREYFQAVMQREEWRTDRLWGDTAADRDDHAHRYVAQRLFNRTDAARVLQLAIPMDSEDGRRLGVVTGDTRVYGLTQALRPPLLRFAVFDSRSGAVLFHSRERLSLAENLLVETEHNSSLEAAMQRRASTWSRHRILAEDHFSGRYLAASHRFLHRSVAGAPWGIVVFYPTDGINDIVLQTAVATLATYFAWIIFLTLAFALLVLALPERADQVALKWIWPKWQSREVYRRVAWWIALALLAIAVVLVGRLNRFDWWEIAGVLAIAGLLVWGLGRLRVRWFPKARPPGLTSYKRSYVQSIFVVLMLGSALPTMLIAIGYHDTSVSAVIRDELEDALGDEEQRRRTLTRDQQRFTGAGLTARASAERSWRLPVPGYQALVENDERRLWLVADVEPTPWLAKCGPPDLGAIRRQIWTLSTARQVRRPIAQGAIQGPVLEPSERPRTRGGECADDIVVRAWLRSEDGVRTRAGFPRESLAGDLKEAERCQSGSSQSGPDMCRDEELDKRYTVGRVLVPGTIVTVCILLMTLMSALAARRLFGIRIPFASRFTAAGSDERDASQLLDAELELLELRKANPMTSKDEADWRSVNCRHIYQRMWSALKTDEQFLVHQLAGGQFANPENQPVIERLLRRGYLTLAPWPRIVEPGFAEFVRTVAPDESFDQLKYDATHTLWSKLRTPLLVLVVIVAVLLMWLAGSAMHLIAATLAGVAGLFGSIQRVTSFLHRDKPPAEVS